MMNVEIRMRARKALRNNWQIALLVGFIAMLPSIISQVVTVLTGGSLTNRLLTLLESSSPQQLMDPDFFTAFYSQLLASSGFIASCVVAVAAWLVAPVLSLGLTAYLLGLFRGTPGQVSAVFSRVGVWYKAIGLNLLVAIKAALWAVPGLALMYGGAYLIAAVADNWNTALSLLSVLLYAGYAAALIPMVMAMLRYAMATYALADAPETTVRGCVARSKQLMKNRKGQLFTLQLSFLGWMLLLALVNSMLSMLLGYVVGSTIYMFLNLALQIYMSAAICAFYLHLCGSTPAAVLPKEEETDSDPWHNS